MRAARQVVVVVLLVQVAWSLPLAVVLAFFGSVPFYVLCSFALVMLVVLFGCMLRWQRADARRDALLATGIRVPGWLVSSRATALRLKNRTVQAHTFEVRTAGQVIRAEARACTHLAIGTEATIAYDPGDPANATVVDDLDRL